MDIRNMKRKELQALCKKHKIPANLTNLEMASRLESLLKDQEKPIARGKSCIKSSGEEASEIYSDHAKRLSKKVRFSPENETFEFLASEIKPAERGRRERARKRSKLRQVEGIQGIVTKDDVNKLVSEAKSKVKKVANEVEYAVKTKGVNRSQKSVAVESVSTVETGVSTRSSKIKEVEKKVEAIDDGLSWKNQTKRTISNRGMKMVKRASDFRENKGVVEDGVAEVELVRRGRKKKTQGQLVDDTSIIGTSSKIEGELEVVLEIEEPLRRSSRFGNRRQSVIPETEKLSTVKDKTKNQRLVIGGMSFIDDAKPKRSSSRLTSVAASDEVVAEKVIKSKLGNSRKRGLVLEEKNLVIIKGERENNILNRRFPVEENVTRKSSRRKPIVPSDKNLAENVKKIKPTVGRKVNTKSGDDEIPFSKCLSDVEERPRKSRRNDAENVKKIKPTVGRKVDMESGEDEVPFSKHLSDVEECPRKSRRNDAEVKKALVTDRTGEAVNSKMLSIKSKEVQAQSISLEESNTVVESAGGCVMNSTGVLCDNLEDKDVFAESVKLEEINPLKLTGLVGKVFDSVKLQNDHVDTVSGICGLEVVLNISTEDEVTFQKNEDEVLQDDYSANEFDVKKNIVKAVGLAEDQLDCIANQVENLDFKKVMELVEDGESETQFCGTLESQKDDEEKREEIEIEDDSGTNDLDSLEPEVDLKEDHLKVDQPDCLEGNEDGLFQGIKSNEDFKCNSFAVLESEVEPIQAIGDVSFDAILGDEGYSQSDQSICLAKQDENIEIKELEMSEFNDMGKHSDLMSTEEQHSLEPEVVLVNSYIEKSTPGQEKGIDRHELGKLADFTSGLSNNRVDVENSYGREEKHFVELENISGNSYGEKNTTVLVHEDFEHNVEDCSAQNKGINSTEDCIENSNEGEPKDSCFLHSSDKHGFMPSKTEATINDNFENSAILEPIDGEESTYKFGLEDQLLLEKASSLNENIKTVNEKKENSSLHYTSDQNQRTDFQVEVEQKDESEMSFDKNIDESVGTPSKSSRDEASSLKEKMHSTQMSVSNEIKSLMMVDLDWIPSSNFRKVHTETVEDRNEVTNENISEEDCQSSPFPHEDNVVADMPGGSFILCENSEMEKPISTEEIQNSGEKNKNKSFGYCYSTESEESDGTENEFDADLNLLNKENETQPFEATSPQTFSGFAENQGFDALNDENVTQPFEATSPQTTSGFAEHQVDSGIVPDSNVIVVLDEKLLDPIKYKDDDTQIIGSLHDGFADDKYIETNILSNSFASNSKSVQTITPSKTQEMTRVEAENSANVESTNGDELTYKSYVEGHVTKDKESILRENFKVVNLENKESSLVCTSDKNEITSCPVEMVRKDVDHISLEHNIAGNVQSPFVTSRDQSSILKAQSHSISEATPMSVSNEIQRLMMVDLDWTPSSEFQKVQTNFMPQEDQATSAFPAVEDQNKIITESISGAGCHSTLFPENLVVADMSKSGEQGRNQSVGYDSSTEPEGSQGTENENEDETRPFSAVSPRITSVLVEHQGNSSTNVDVSSTERSLLFDDEVQRDVNSGSVAVSKDDNDVIDEDVIEHGNEETQLIGSFDDDGFADTPCVETMAYKASSSKSVFKTYLAKEANEGDEEMVSIQGYDDTFKEINTPDASNKLDGEIAFENVEKGNITDKDRGDVPMENRDGISHIPEELTPVQTEEKHENLVNASKELQGDETQYGDGMFDDLYGDEMEMVQDYAEKFGKATTTKAVTAVENHTHTHNTIDNAHCVDESKEYRENQYFSNVSQRWSPDPDFGIFQASLDSNMFSSWEQNMSEAKAKKSIPVGNKAPFIEEKNTSFQLKVNDETEISAASVTDEVFGSGQTETISQCEAANIPDSVIETEPLKYAGDAVHDGFAIVDVEEKLELVDVDGREVKCKPLSLNTTSKTLKIRKQSSLIRGTPKKLATNFDMKENAASIKREIMGSATAKSIVKRRALSELQK